MTPLILCVATLFGGLCGSIDGRTHRVGSRTARTARVDVDHELEIAHDACPLRERLHKEIPTWPQEGWHFDAEPATSELPANPVFSATTIHLFEPTSGPASATTSGLGPRAPPLA